MTPEARTETIKQVYKGLEAGDPNPLFEMLDDDMQWTIIGSSKYSGTFKGVQDLVDRLISPLHEQLDGHIHITPENFIADGDFVVVQGRGEAKTATGSTYNNVYCFVFEWRGEKVVKVTEYADTELITTAFGR